MTFKNILRKRALALPVAIIVASGGSLAALSSGAWFTDSDSVANNTIQTGTIDLDATPDSAAFIMNNMAPGDVFTAPIIVNNPGSLAFKYTISGTSGGPLAPALQTTVKAGVTTCTPAGFDATGTAVGSANTVLGAKAVIGSRPALSSWASETLCVKVAMPSSVNNAYANSAANMTFDFDATQVAAP